MYDKTVTVFNRYENADGVTWYPSTLIKTDFNADKAKIVATYGENSTDSASLHIKLKGDFVETTQGEKEFLLPKEWARQVNDDLSASITFTSGQGFDFIYVGEWDSTPVNDDDYREGFFNYMNKRYDNVFAVTGFARYGVIPHIEVTAR